VDAVTFGVMTIAVLAVRTRRAGGRLADRDSEHGSEHGGWALLRTDPVLGPLVLGLAAFVLLGFTANVVMVFLVRETLHASATWYGAVGATWVLGIVAGALAAGRIRSGQTATEQTATRQITTGQTTTGQTATEQPPTGQTTTGQTATEQPPTGQTTTGQTTTEQPPTGQTTTGQTTVRQVAARRIAAATRQTAPRRIAARQTTTGQSAARRTATGHLAAAQPAARRIAAGTGHARAALAGTGLMALALAGYGLAPAVVVLVPVSILGGIGNGLANVSVATLVMTRSAERVRGRVSAALGAVINAASVSALVVGGGLAAVLGPRLIFLLAGALGALVTAITAARLPGAVTRIRLPGAALRAQVPEPQTPPHLLEP
jgi:MFS family permease